MPLVLIPVIACSPSQKDYAKTLIFDFSYQYVDDSNQMEIESKLANIKLDEKVQLIVKNYNYKKETFTKSIEARNVFMFLKNLFKQSPRGLAVSNG